MIDWMQAAATDAASASPFVSTAPPVCPGRVLHIDGDMIAYWAGGNEDTPVTRSRAIAHERIQLMTQMAGAERTVLHLTAASSSKADRFLISTVKPYQGQRKSGRKPKNWEYLRDYLEHYTDNDVKVKLWATREADDGVAWQMTTAKGHHVCCSADKDFRMIPGWHLDWKDLTLVHVPLGCYDIVHNELQYGHKWFWCQMLHGDTADNIPGLPAVRNGKGVFVQCGPKKVSLLDGTRSNYEAWEVVSSLYQDYYGDEWNDMMVEQALLLWLRTDAKADMLDVLEVLPAAFHAHTVTEIKKRVKEKYAEAHRITGVSPVRSDG